MKTKTGKVETKELLELMEIPQVRQVMLAKLEQLKLIFSKEIKGFYKEKYPNLLTFPGKEQNRAARGEPGGEELNHGQSGNRVNWDNKRGFFDTTRFMELEEEEQITLFLEYFENNGRFRREILHEFFLKKMPYADIYEETG